MKKRGSLLLFVILSVVFVLSFVPVSAQEADLGDMTNEQLLLLLQAIMQKLEQDEAAPEALETAAPGPVSELPAVNDEQTAPKARLFRIYENKKLIVEALPSYIFVRPEEEDETPVIKDKDKKDDHKEHEDDNSCPPPSLCKPGVYCTYHITPEGKCVCMCG